MASIAEQSQSTVKKAMADFKAQWLSCRFLRHPST
jgi:hypothetical protein